MKIGNQNSNSSIFYFYFKLSLTNSNITQLLHTGNIREQEVFFTGTLEKAARNDQGLVRGWRQRFFQLNTTSLSYFTKPRGDRKGIIRVLGGGVRRMDASETGVFFANMCVECFVVVVVGVFFFLFCNVVYIEIHIFTAGKLFVGIVFCLHRARI